MRAENETPEIFPVPIAVVIPLFNHERFIGEALRSVLAQTRAADRIVIVDDGSTDRSVKNARAVSDTRITILSQPNAGAHAALNRGITEAARDCGIIAILNSDDLFEPARLEKCAGFLEKNPALDVVCTRLKMIDADSRELASDDPKTRWVSALWQARRAHLAEWLGVANFTKTSSNFVARADYLLAHPFRPYRYVHDYFFAVAAALEGRLGVLDEQLLRYRTHAANTIKSGPAENVTREVLKMNLDLLREFAPGLAASEKLRADYAKYFRTLSQNFADFRAEVFLEIIAGILRELPGNVLEQRLRGHTGALFPELNAGKSPALKEQRALADYDDLLRELAASRWLALGRVFGAAPDVRRSADAGAAHERLSALKKQCRDSRWLQLGIRLGLVYTHV